MRHLKTHLSTVSSIWLRVECWSTSNNLYGAARVPGSCLRNHLSSGRALNSYSDCFLLKDLEKTSSRSSQFKSFRCKPHKWYTVSFKAALPLGSYCGQRTVNGERHTGPRGEKKLGQTLHSHYSSLVSLAAAPRTSAEEPQPLINSDEWL
ncbi:unnamed protein product [Pleuronectes platessa]|uniref:Uncharacterized protein n=1 Tax=Pleuronectes platessa TaxID=8262 RepID=A0A9N7TXX8_PLEPL|nr:unnamed protein product [Pleuronectes platessa]